MVAVATLLIAVVQPAKGPQAAAVRPSFAGGNGANVRKSAVGDFFQMD
jgi:hypothetical protein